MNPKSVIEENINILRQRLQGQNEDGVILAITREITSQAAMLADLQIKEQYMKRDLSK